MLAILQAARVSGSGLRGAETLKGSAAGRAAKRGPALH